MKTRSLFSVPLQPRAAPKRRKRILLLSVSAGAGHVRAAEAIRHVADAHEDGVEGRHLDVMDYVPALFRWLYTDLYISIVNRFPGLWGALYRVTDEARPGGVLQRLRRFAERLNTLALRREIAAFRPDAIVCTHFLPAEVLARMARKGMLACPLWVQVTDFDLHRIWVQPGVTGYFAANEEVAFRLRAHGVAPQAIRVTGIPVMPAFARAAASAGGAQEAGLDARRRIVLLMGGGAGLGSLEQVAASLLALDVDMQLVVLAGKNRAALAALQRLAARYPGRLLPLGFTDRVERLMACADLVITKPGGLTVSECLAMGLPAILHAPIPGQEERNANFLLEQGAALNAGNGVALAYRVCHLLRHPEQMARMRERAAALGRPDAARHVLQAVLAGLRADEA